MFFRTLSTHQQRADLRTNFQHVTPPALRGPSDPINSRLWLFTSVCFLLGGVLELCLSNRTIAFSDFITGLACLIPPIGIGMLNIRSRCLWWTGLALLWLAQLLMLFRTGGIGSPLFGSQMLSLLLVMVCVFERIQLQDSFLIVALHVLGWSLLSYGFKLSVPRELNLSQVFVQNLLALLTAFSAILTMVRSTEFYAKEYKLQSKRLAEAQNHLHHAEKMAEIGKIVATTAHELAQPIQVIAMTSELIRKISERSQAEKDIVILTSRLSDASSRLKKLLTQLRDFSRKDPFTRKTVNLVEVIRSVETLSQYDLRWNGVRYESEFSEETILTYGDSMRLQQVLFNLINNARDACGNIVDPVVRVTAKTYREWVRVMVWNNGVGIPIHQQGKLFAPYFTTKEPGRGTGLGLTVCQQLVDQHGGRVLFSSKDGDTTFVVDLPRYIGKVEHAPLLESATL